MKRLILWVLIFSLLTIPVIADELKIDNVDAVVNGVLINNVDNNYESLELEFGDRIDLIIDFENEYRPSTDIDIQVLDLFVSLDDVNLVSESMNFDIDAGEEVTRRVTFSVPNLEKGIYSLKIEVEGRDDDNHIQEDVEFVNLLIKKEEPIFVRNVGTNKQSTKESIHDVNLRFTENPYSYKKQSDSNFPYLIISLIAIIFFLLTMFLIYQLHKVNKS